MTVGRLSQLPLEIVTQPSVINARLSQLVAEVVCTTPPTDVPASGPNSDVWQVKLEDGGNQESGARNLLIYLKSDGATSVPADNVARFCSVYSALVPVQNVRTIVFGGSIKWTNAIGSLPTGVGVAARLEIRYYDASFNEVPNYVYLGLNGQSGKVSMAYWDYGFGSVVSSGGVWVRSPALPNDVPPGAVYAQMICSAIIIANQLQRAGVAFDTGTGNVYANIRFDDVYLIPQTDPSKTVAQKGSTVPSLSSAFSYTTTATSVTIKWNGLAIYRADGTITYPGNSQQIVSGLTASTTYYFYPYWDDDSEVLTFVSGGIGTNGFAFTSSSAGISQAQAQILRNRIPLSIGPLSAATPSSGTGGGSIGGSGRGCLREGSLVRTDDGHLTKVEDLKMGDRIWSRQGWTEVTFVQVAPCDQFLRLTLQDGSVLECSASHPFTLPNLTGDGDIVKRASELCLEDMLYITDGACFLKSIEVVKAADRASKVTISCYPCHEFYAGEADATVLSHNIYVNS